MRAKLQAAKISVCSGVPMVIANGQKPGVIHDIISGKKVGTLFLPKEKPMHSRKRWIAFGLTVQGTLCVDSGAKKAVVRDGKSLLPSGVLEVEGSFERGETVCIADEDGIVFARGLVNYPSRDLIKIKGLRSSKILEVLGEKGESEVVHRDNLVVI